MNLFTSHGVTAHHLAKLTQEMQQSDDRFSRVEGLTVQEVKSATEAIAALLRQHLPDPEYRNADGETALFHAAVAGNVSTTSLLLAGGAKVNAQRPDGMTPLMVAISRAQKNARRDGVQITVAKSEPKSFSTHGHFVKTLLKKGADLSLRNNAGKTALDFARESGNEEILSLLQRGKR